MNFEMSPCGQSTPFMGSVFIILGSVSVTPVSMSINGGGIIAYRVRTAKSAHKSAFLGTFLGKRTILSTILGTFNSVRTFSSTF